jgi:hypothetical protein
LEGLDVKIVKINSMKNKLPIMPGFRLVPDSIGIILDSIWIKDDNSEIIIKSAFGGQWTFRHLFENEKSI